LIFTNNYDYLNSFKLLLNKFLSQKGLIVKKQHEIYFKSSSIFYSFRFLNWKFRNLQNNNIISDISNNSLRYYKSQLKGFIKNSQNFSVAEFLTKINFMILKWRIKNNYCTSFVSCAYKLDVYLYRLIWKWAKRKHSRRSNSWIYENYWRAFGGVWKFVTTDNNNGNLIFLKSHISLKTKRLCKLPRSFKVFNLENYQKLNFIWFNKSQLSFNLIYRVLWNKQNGTCFNCLRQLNYFHFNDMTIFKKTRFLKSINSPVSELILIHKHCKF
jgi:RNA-directed DNA polymerase